MLRIVASGAMDNMLLVDARVLGCGMNPGV